MNFDADFGFAQYLNSEEQTQTMRGSPLYMVINKINVKCVGLDDRVSSS